ncbi:hypothetical protein FA95DRAFT_693700 [Auriscalpium vulgare]|uniref:Uncharacterized protein n=1 Tax=Auriscalpium vulgare TaxID=40419 RepID=A0ACB8RBP2_9AGAM|nr:hypothetical protein FA95DRAFT_693700 [Auriscalpium vulgare]
MDSESASLLANRQFCLQRAACARATPPLYIIMVSHDGVAIPRSCLSYSRSASLRNHPEHRSTLFRVPQRSEMASPNPRPSCGTGGSWTSGRARRHCETLSSTSCGPAGEHGARGEAQFAATRCSWLAARPPDMGNVLGTSAVCPSRLFSGRRSGPAGQSTTDETRAGMSP